MDYIFARTIVLMRIVLITAVIFRIANAYTPPRICFLMTSLLIVAKKVSFVDTWSFLVAIESNSFMAQRQQRQTDRLFVVVCFFLFITTLYIYYIFRGAQTRMNTGFVDKISYIYNVKSYIYDVKKVKYHTFITSISYIYDVDFHTFMTS